MLSLVLHGRGYITNVKVNILDCDAVRRAWLGNSLGMVRARARVSFVVAGQICVHAACQPKTKKSRVAFQSVAGLT